MCVCAQGLRDETLRLDFSPPSNDTHTLYIVAIKPSDDIQRVLQSIKSNGSQQKYEMAKIREKKGDHLPLVSQPVLKW